MNRRKNESSLLIIFAFALPQTLVADDHLSQTNCRCMGVYFQGDTTAGDIVIGPAISSKMGYKNNLRLAVIFGKQLQLMRHLRPTCDGLIITHHGRIFTRCARSEKSGGLAKDYDSMVTCGNHDLQGMRMGGPAPQAKQKPLVVNVCQPNEGKTMQDVMTFAPKATALINETVGQR